MSAVLEIRGLSIAYGPDEVVRDLSLKIGPGESFGLVGESGSGKSSVANAVVAGLRPPMRTKGQILYHGQDLLQASPDELRALRGSRIGFVQQDPGSSLNPTMRLGKQLLESLEGSGQPKAAQEAEVAQMLRRVGLDNAEAIMGRFPHQISGGQQQRVMIAMALLPRPDLILMDEPTSGLDVTVEAAVIDLIAELQAEMGMSLLFISHNLQLVSKACHRVGVLYAGDLVEEAPAGDIFRTPRHPYAQGLVRCLPGVSPVLEPIRGQVPAPADRGQGCLFATRCDHAVEGVCDRPPAMQHPGPDHRVLCTRMEALPAFGFPAASGTDRSTASRAPAIELRRLVKTYPVSGGGQITVTRDVSLALREAEILGLVGESGSGKSTIAKIIGGYEQATGGVVVLDGEDIGNQPIRKRRKALLQQVQMVFQNPDSTLNPSHRIGWALGRAVRRFEGPIGRKKIDARVRELLELVALPPEVAQRRPRALSGGQRQRVAIARALAANPRVLIADEAVSALDVSVQASIVRLLRDIRRKTGTAILFISHDLALVRQISDRIVVLFGGKVMEIGPAEAVHAPPFHPYTEALLSAEAGTLRQAVAQKADARAATTGCPFASRCPKVMPDLCTVTEPEYQTAAEGHEIYCHIPPAELAAATLPEIAGTEDRPRINAAMK